MTRQQPDRRPRRASAAALGSVMLIGALSIALRSIRIGEATASFHLLTAAGVPARHVGATVIIATPDSAGAGYTVAAGCSSAVLLLPFGILAVALVGSGRVRLQRVAVALLGPVLLLPLINQIRFALIGIAIKRWGFDSGYGPAHLAAGTVVSTVGLVTALAMFVIVCLRPGRVSIP